MLFTHARLDIQFVYDMLHAGRREFKVAAMGAEQDLENVPGVDAKPDPATKGFIFQQARRCASSVIWKPVYLSTSDGSEKYQVTLYCVDYVPHQGPKAIPGLLHPHHWHEVRHIIAICMDASSLPAASMSWRCVSSCNILLITRYTHCLPVLSIRNGAG